MAAGSLSSTLPRLDVGLVAFAIAYFFVWEPFKRKDHIFAKHDTCNKCDNATMKPTDGSAWGVAVDPSSQSQPQSQGDGAAAATEDSAAAQDGSNTSAAAADEDEAAIVAEAA